MANVQIDEIQIKRGNKEALEAILVGDKKPKFGEPVLELDTQRLKFGDGKNDYINLPYFNTSTTIDFAIQNPVTGQIFMYDASTGVWKNVNLIGTNLPNITYNQENGLTLYGYNGAEDGQIPVKDSTVGLKWITPASTEELNRAVENAHASAVKAETAATQAGNSAAESYQAAAEAERNNALTVEFVNKKFWWGTVEEYNALTQITEGTIYCIKE